MAGAQENVNKYIHALLCVVPVKSDLSLSEANA